MMSHQASGRRGWGRLIAVAVSLGLVTIAWWQMHARGFLSSTSIASVLMGRATGRLDASSAARRDSIDTSGLNTVGPHVPPWKNTATLEEIRDIWTGTVRNGVGELDELLSRRPLSGEARVTLTINKAAVLNFSGEAEKSYSVLSDLRTFVAENKRLAREHLGSVIYFQGVTALRRGENDNCVMCRGESACIIPISESAVHSNPTGSRLAIGHFTEYLAQFPDDLEVRWLLNIAHMTLGEYPDGVDSRYRLDLSRFFESKLDIGRFREIGGNVGLNRFNAAGAEVMDDFDNDGLLDVIVTSFLPMETMSYHRNKGDGTFEDRTPQAGISGQLGGMVCYQADHDNDGHLDVIVPRGAWMPYPIRPSLLRNTGGGVFVDITKQAGLMDSVNCNAGAWADFDNDGFIDFFMGCERQTNRLFHNKRDGTFEEVAEKAGVQGIDGDFCKGCSWIDYDNDGYPDLFLNNARIGRLLHNNRDGTFTDVSSEMGIDGPNSGFSCWAWDYDNDGWLDIFATCFDRTLGDVVKGLLGQPHSRYSNRLFHNVKGKRFENLTDRAGLNLVFSCMGSNFADFDNDGWLDMYLGTGEPSYATLVPNRMFKNVNGERFVDITGSTHTGHLQKGHGIACGDWDRDGDIDVFVQTGGAAEGDRYHNLLFQNPGQGNHWLTIKLVGKKTNRAAIGARIKVTPAGANQQTIYRHVSSGSSYGGSPLQQTVGLAQAQRVAQLEIYWPTSRTTQVFHDVAADQAIEITELVDSYRQLNWTPIQAPQ